MYRLTWLTWKLWVIPHVPSQSVFILCIFTMAVVLRGRQEPGGICVSRTVCNHVRNKVGLAFEAMGEHKVKNIAEPITVYRVRPGSGGTTAIRALATPALRRRRLAAIAAAVVLPGMRHKLWAGEGEPVLLPL
jgi:adenylate cyclase